MSLVNVSEPALRQQRPPVSPRPPNQDKSRSVYSLETVDETNVSELPVPTCSHAEVRSWSHQDGCTSQGIGASCGEDTVAASRPMSLPSRHHAINPSRRAFIPSSGEDRRHPVGPGPAFTFRCGSPLPTLPDPRTSAGVHLTQGIVIIACFAYPDKVRKTRFKGHGPIGLSLVFCHNT
jgi:hypothetical protein